jgi:hypothetical protein
LASVPITAFIPIVFIGVIVIVIAVLTLNASRRKETALPSKYSFKTPTRQPYISGGFSQQMELDMRLPYRRFKQIYPHSNITYDEYKRLQMQKAFRRSLSSQENSRMVR